MGIDVLHLTVGAKRIWAEQIEPVKKEIIATMPRSFRYIDALELSDEDLEVEVARTLRTVLIDDETEVFKDLFWKIAPYERRFILTKLIRQDVTTGE